MATDTAAQPPAEPQEELLEDASYESMNLAAMVLSDCGHSSNYEPLLERVAGRIDRHVERLLAAQREDLTTRAQAEPAQPPAGFVLVPTELAERVQETMGEFLMDHGWRQQDMDTSDEFGALLAVATKAAPAPVAWLQADAAQRDQLLAFTKEVMQAWPEGGIDGGELQDIALAHGLLRPAEPPPDWDGCNFYERTELIK